jgi:hypothetical protein
MYNKILNNIDVDECSIVCLKTVGCISYDYNAVLQKCYLSRYTMQMVGGLNMVNTEWTHYELNANKFNLKSNLIVSDKMIIRGAEKTYVKIETFFNKNSSLLVIEGGKINFNRKVEISSSAGVELCGSLIFDYNDNNTSNYNYNNSDIKVLNESHVIEKGLILLSSSYIRGNMCLANSKLVNSKIIFQNGNHDIYGTLNGNYTLTTQNNGNVTIYQNSSKVLHLNSITIENSSLITVIPLNSSSHAYKNKIEMVIYMENLKIINEGELLLKALKNTIDISHLTLSDNGILSVEGSGTNFNNKPKCLVTY